MKTVLVLPKWKDKTENGVTFIHQSVIKYNNYNFIKKSWYLHLELNGYVVVNDNTFGYNIIKW